MLYATVLAKVITRAVVWGQHRPRKISISAQILVKALMHAIKLAMTIRHLFMSDLNHAKAILHAHALVHFMILYLLATIVVQGMTKHARTQELAALVAHWSILATMPAINHTKYVVVVTGITTVKTF